MVLVTIADGFQLDYAKSVGRMPQCFIKELGLVYGEVIEVISGNRRIGISIKPLEELNLTKDFIPKTLFKSRVIFSNSIGEIPLHVNGFVRSALKVSLGQKVKIDKTNSPEAIEILVAAVNPERRDEIFNNFFWGRPVTKGQVLELFNNLNNDLKVGIVRTKPSGIVSVVKDKTQIWIAGETPKELLKVEKDVMYDDIGGHLEILTRLRTLVEYPLRHPEIFEMLNIQPPQGILITGPSGSGKTYISKAVASESGVTRFFIGATEIVKGWWTAEGEMDKYFDHIIKYEPALVIIDQIEVLARAPGPNVTDLEIRMKERLIKNLEKIRGKKIIVIGTTIDANEVHPDLRIYGRLEIELPLRIPNYNDRLEILNIKIRGIPCDNVNLQEVAKNTGGYTPADLELLVKEASMCALERQHQLDLDSFTTKVNPSDSSKESQVERERDVKRVNLQHIDFISALTTIKPTASREMIVQIPKVTWDDIGGLEPVKQSLKEMLEWPIRFPENFSAMGIRPPKGVLLYGPPGTGKTLLAKAIAHEIKANFLVVRGPELLSKWFSESARMVRDLFKRARQLAPAIIFFDEIDALAPRRSAGTPNSGGGTKERDQIINQLLASMDGIETVNNGVYVMGATNRPDVLDPALLRPGRFDRLIRVPAPDHSGRIQILKVHTRNMQLSNVDLDELASKSKDFSGADLENWCREAAFVALRKDFSTRIVTNENFKEALKVCRPSITPETINYYQRLEKEMNHYRVLEYTRLPQEYS